MAAIEKIINTMSSKSDDSTSKTLKLSLFAGFFISFGALLYLLATSTSAPMTLSKFIGSLLFTIGLNFVVFFKAQLFTGNNLMFVSIMKKTLLPKKVIRNWVLVYLGNFIGALICAFIISFILGQFESLQQRAIEIAQLKTSYTFTTALLKAMFCNMLVCIAIYFGIVMETKIKKIIGIVIPITIFVFMGFEHSIANMFFIPLGFFNSQIDLVLSSKAFVSNIVPVTIGNLLGGFVISLAITLLNKKTPSS